MEPQRRLEVARKIVSAAGDHGIPPEDVVIDPLAMPVGAEPRAVTLFIETVRLIRDDLGVNMTCGASNTSFGLPGRHTLSATFLAIADSHGLTSAIMDARVPAVRRGGARRRLPARPRRVGRSLDRRPPRKAGGRGIVSAAEAVDAGHRPRAADLPARRRRGAGPRGHDGVRRRQLERHRDRLHLRRPRHLQKCKVKVLDGDVPIDTARPARVPARRAARRLAAGLPGDRPRRPRRSRCRRCRRGPRRRWSASAAT